jgi:hypothetical protein
VSFFDYSKLNQTELLQTYAELMSELRHRGVLRSSNNPVADYTEWLVAKKLSLELRGNSASGYDAVDAKGKRYQIKGRRLTTENGSTQLSALRNLEQGPFDYLAAVVYNPDFSVAYAGLLPHKLVCENCRFSKHQNGHIFMMRRSVLELPGVIDISQQLAT